MKLRIYDCERLGEVVRIMVALSGKKVKVVKENCELKVYADVTEEQVRAVMVTMSVLGVDPPFDIEEEVVEE